MRIPSVPISLLSAALAACGGAEAGSGSAAVRDSAGVRIVESAAPARDSASAWRVADTPFVSIGREEGPPEQQLYDVRSALRFPDGRIAIANAGSGEIRIYDPRGRHLSSFGREGDGPGEFRGLDRLWIGPGDSLVAYDALAKRFTTFAPDGSVSATRALPEVAGRAGSTLLVGRFGDGGVLVKAGAPLAPDAGEGLARQSAVYAAGAPGDSAARPVGELFDGERYVQRTGAGATGYERPFAGAPQAAVGRDAFYHSEGARYDIRRYSPDGTLESVIRRRADPVPVTDDDVRRDRERLLAQASGPNRARLEQFLANVPIPQHRPAHGRMLVDSEGHLWVLQTRAAEDQPFRWDVFAPDGAWRTTVSLPARFRLMEPGPDYVLGVEYHPESDVEQVRAYRLERGEPGR
jgi:hypothetical protein